MNPDLKIIEKSLEKGDYTQSLNQLKSLAKVNPITENDGAIIRLLMVTALVGKGEEKEAILTCRLLLNCKNSDIRQRARQLLSVLESPKLERPYNWSLKIPSLKVNVHKLKGNKLGEGSSKKLKTVNLPKTGPTRNLNLGFTGFVLIVLIGLTILLSGCVQITTLIKIPGPDRISLSMELESAGNKLLPWQANFENSLKSKSSGLHIEKTAPGKQEITSEILHAEDAELLLRQIIDQAGKQSGIKLNPPELSLKERNFLIGIHQKLNLKLDLRKLPKIPGLNLKVILNLAPMSQKIDTSPATAKIEKKFIEWNLESGEINFLQAQSWRWSKLSLGAILIIAILIINLLLQNIRVQLGFGFPELPP